MIFFDHVDHGEPGRCVAGHREPHRVPRTVARKAVTAAARITAVADLPLARFGRLNDIGQLGVASAEEGIAQGKPRRANPPGDFQTSGGHEKRARHGICLAGCILTD
jgi:hypothetical protein